MTTVATSEREALMDLIYDQYVQHVLRRRNVEVFPNTYLVFDIETSGFNKVTDEILQFGFREVRDGEVVSTMEVKLKYPEAAAKPSAKKAIEVNGLTPEILEREGQDPVEVLHLVHGILVGCQASGGMFVGHNAYSFDAPFVEQKMKVLGLPLIFGDDLLIDTGMWAKAGQIGLKPTERDTLRSFYYRVANYRSFVKWNLAHCIDLFGIDADKSKAHDAGYDCLLTDLVLRAILEVQDDIPF